MIVHELVVYGANKITPNLSAFNFAVDVVQSLTSRLEVVFDFTIDEVSLLIKSFIEFSVFGLKV